MGNGSNVSRLTATISLAWWIFPYLRVVTALGLWIGQEPNWERVGYWVRKATIIRVVS